MITTRLGKILLYILNIILSLLPMYLINSFLTVNLNLLEWNIFYKILFIIGSLFIMVISIPYISVYVEVKCSKCKSIKNWKNGRCNCK